MKKIILAIMAVFLFTNVAWAYNIEPGPKVVVNGKEVISDVQPVIVDGRTMIPARALAEALGADVNYDNGSNTVKVDWNKDMKAHVTLGGLMLSNQQFAKEVLALVDKYFNQKTNQQQPQSTSTPTTQTTLPQTTSTTTPTVTQGTISPKPDLSGQIAAMRAQEIPEKPGFTITLNGRIHNLIIELQIHKLRFEPESTFKSMVQGTMIQETANTTLTLSARQFNNIATQVIYGSISDDDAISQLQTTKPTVAAKLKSPKADGIA